MTEDVGELRLFFLLKSVVGISTVSLSTLEQCKWKKGYACLWLMVHICVYILCLIRLYNKELPNHIDASRQTLGFLTICYILVQSIVDHKTEIAAALNLQALKGQMVSENVMVVPKKNAHFLVFIIMTSSIMLFQTIKLLNVSIFHVKVLDYVVLTHNAASGLLYIGSYLSLMYKSVQLCESLDRAVYEASHLERQSSGWRVCQPGQPDIMVVKMLNFVKEIRGGLNNIQADIHGFYWKYISCFLIITTFLLPTAIFNLFYSWGESSIVLFDILLVFLAYISSCMAIIHTNKKVNEERFSAMLTLSHMSLSSENVQHRKTIKRQMLACIQQPSPHSCYLFDLEYSLFLDIMDSVLMVFTTLTSSTN